MGVSKHRKNHKQKLQQRTNKSVNDKRKFQQLMANLQKVQTKDEFEAALQKDAVSQQHQVLIEQIEKENLLQKNKFAPGTNIITAQEVKDVLDTVKQDN